jgi:pimeloyl-ACP methyl ester carboxylesterase
MSRVWIAATFLLYALPALASPPQCVILLHGMGRKAGSMEEMQEALTGAGYVVINDTYPSREYPIEVLAPLAVESGLDKCTAADSAGPVHFVTHSLGGILVRYYYDDHETDGVGRVVMLGPPNQGSDASDAMRNVPGFDFVTGPAGSQLGKGPNSVPRNLGAPSFEFGVIAGTRTIDPITSAVLPNPDDGKVSVTDTRLDGMADFKVIKVSHAFMMKDEEVIEQVIHFLQHGSFSDTDE